MPFKGGIATRLALLSSLVALVATATVGYMVYSGARDSLIESASDRVAHTSETIRVRTWDALTAIGDDVRFLAETPPVQGIVRARIRRGLDPLTAIRDDEWGEQLAEIFRSFLDSRSSYMQARFIGLENDGRELVRVERRNGEAIFADVESLRTRGDARYVQVGSQMAAGGIFYSEVRRGDQREDIPPNIPVLYVATPVLTDEGAPFGVVVVTVNFRDIIEPMQTAADANQTMYVANSRGELLHVSGRSAAIAEEAGADRVQALFPAAEELIAGAPREIRMLDARLGRATRGIAYFEEIPLDVGQDSPHMLIGVSEPHETILAGVRRVRNQSAIITLLLCIAAIGVAIGTSRYLTTPLRQITRAVASFGDDGDGVSLPVDRSDEIGVLARSFEAMERQIQEQIRALEDEEGRQRTVLETSAEGIVVTDQQGSIEAFNPAAEVIFGWSASEALGSHLSNLIPADVIGPILEGTEREPGSGVETVGNRPKGGVMPIALLWSTFEWGGERKYTVFVQDISERKEAEGARERLVRELESERTRLRDLSETLEARVRERTSELEALTMDLEASNRELTEIAKVASHDLQEPLRKLRSFADLLEAEYNDVLDENGRFYVRRIFDLAERMSRLMADLLAFSRVTSRPKTPAPVDLCRVAEEAAAQLDRMIEELGATIRVERLPKVEADPDQMRALFQHLIDNALTHRKQDVPPEVVIRGELAGKGSNGTCRVEVEDNGLGFDEKYADRIFAPFERLHAGTSPQGTGMGLTICRRIVANHRGKITARSTPGLGSTFVVELPTALSQE